MTLADDFQETLPAVVHVMGLPGHELEPCAHLCGQPATEEDPDEVEVIYHDAVLSEAGKWLCTRCGEAIEADTGGE
jgi:hypothetical protein